MPRVKVRFFATVREAAGAPQADLDARDLSELFLLLERRFGPRFGRFLKEALSEPERMVVLVNGKNLGRRPDPKHVLREGDEVAIFPPVSGG